ncbi:MAG: hypothetical protein JW891_04690 [Candidatus Lokiarchaeota archaeon]|nr:hypothetical protein [Candidatus Lokiarchaeota archaeon]
MKNTSYPPENICNPTKFDKRDYDHIILWMLYNNDSCQWSDFIQDPIGIPIGTLSRHLTLLKQSGFVNNFERGKYQITTDGKKEFHKLSNPNKKGRQVNYPPKIILNTGRNYSDWILWMVYNNNFCKRTDFLEEPLSINHASLSKNLNQLMNNGLIIKTDGKYEITVMGKSAYSKLLQQYDLDRQTILEAEMKTIEFLTNKTNNFFTKYEINNFDIQFKFLIILLKLDYEKVKSLLKNEEEYFKIVLFFAINHPDHYPNYMSPKEFSIKYQVKRITLDYYVEEIFEGMIYPVRFFKLIAPSGGEFYFHSGEKIERMLQVLTEHEINKFAYMNVFYQKSQYLSNKNLNLILDRISENLCASILSPELKSSLKGLLPEYINFLAYKIEFKKELKDKYDKLEGMIWQKMVKFFDLEASEGLNTQFKENIEDINEKIASTRRDIDLYYSKLEILIYFNQYKDVLNLLDEMLVIFPEKEVDLLMKKASIFKKRRNLSAGMDIIDNLIEKYKDNSELLSYKAFWYQYMNKKDDAIKVIQTLIKKYPEKGIYFDNYGEILMYFEDYEQAADKFLKALIKGEKEWYTYQTYIKLGVCYKTLGNFELAIKNLKRGKELLTEVNIDPDDKQKWTVIADLFIAETSDPKFIQFQTRR